MAEKVREGQQAPRVDLPAALSESVLEMKSSTLKLTDLKGRNVVLFFYPRAMTGGCTKEACGFRDRVSDFAKLDTVIVGISTDSLARQEKFTVKEGLNFPLLADAEKKIAQAFGVLKPEGTSSRRATFIIDKQGKIAKVFDPVKKASDHPQEVLDFLRGWKP